ncbi:MAG: protein-glutamate O-methyltransferase CheR [Acidobacteria bacterium]|nr:protein-glutamate O-methyltransferase CheR [Acidobacteriota bacterium]MCA1643728.1 protein-glutamate O-methyltransferase CheR [Acidobacteriota bacterium]
MTAAARAGGEQLEDIEIALLLEGLYRFYGFDFRDYSPASLKRRIVERMRAEKIETISAFQDRVLHDAACMERLLLGLSVHVTSMFRDPSFYLTFRRKVVPVLKTYPTVRVWHAGCSTGEEVYSMAILLQEEGLYRKCVIYATDISREVLRRAREGIFPLASMQEYTTNYVKAGGKHEFSDYYTADYDNVIFHPALKTNVVFAEHNLATDGSFNEFHVILCRNVMIYFNRALQDRVHELIYESLSTFGVLGLGNKETLKTMSREPFYEKLDARDKLYRKVG